MPRTIQKSLRDCNYNPPLSPCAKRDLDSVLPLCSMRVSVFFSPAFFQFFLLVCPILPIALSPRPITKPNFWKGPSSQSSARKGILRSSISSWMADLLTDLSKSSKNTPHKFSTRPILFAAKQSLCSENPKKTKARVMRSIRVSGWRQGMSWLGSIVMIPIGLVHSSTSRMPLHRVMSSGVLVSAASSIHTTTRSENPLLDTKTFSEKNTPTPNYFQRILSVRWQSSEGEG